jgi:hypothetical protein
MSKLAMVGLFVVVLLLALPILIRVFKLLFVRTVVRKAFKDIGNKAIAKQSDTIHLVPKSMHTWADRDAMDKLAQPLKSRGFVEAGVYEITEMPGVGLRMLLNQATNVYACLYEHPKAGRWAEVITRYQNGFGATYTQLPDRGMTRRDEDVVVNAPATDAGTLYDRMIKERPQKPMISLSEGNIPRLFEQVWSAQVKWKKERGAKPEEVAKVVASLKEHPIGKGQGSN